MNQLQFSVSIVINENIYKNLVTDTLDTASKVADYKSTKKEQLITYMLMEDINIFVYANLRIIFSQVKLL